jgi:hypothetical protein
MPDIPFPTKPDYSDYYDYWGYIDWEAYDDASEIYSQEVDSYYAAWESLYDSAVEKYLLAYDEYETQYNEYISKMTRDELRNLLKEETVTLKNTILCYYDGESSSQITDTYHDYRDFAVSKPVLIYESYEETEPARLDITNVQDVEDVRTYALYPEHEKVNIYAIIYGKTQEIEDDTGDYYGVTGSGSRIFYLDDWDEEEKYGNLYMIEITGDELGKSSIYDMEVRSYTMFENNEDIYYFKDCQDDSGDLYRDKKRVDFDVDRYQLYSMKSTSSILYVTDYDEESKEGTLKLYNGNTSIVIGTDVHDFYATDDNFIIYLQDYDIKRLRGDAYLYDGSKQRKVIDEDVSVIIMVQDN